MTMLELGRKGAAMPRRRLLVLSSATVLLGLMAAPPAMLAADDPARAFVVAFAAKAVALLGDRKLGPDERARRFEALVRQSFELDTIAQLALGRYWRTASEPQRQAYVERFEQLVLASYAKRLNDYAGQTLEVGEATPSGRDTMVASWIEGGDRPIRIDWRVRGTDAGPRFVDVVVEGVSLLVTHRNELAAVMEKTGSIDGLIAELDHRLQRAEGTGLG
jgi:phospholipid transport system substrate-binding protein